jgi:hypothetical protein
LPDPPQTEVGIAGIRLPRLAIAAGQDPCPAVLAALRTAAFRI